jgi:hypothetical protein
MLIYLFQSFEFYLILHLLLLKEKECNTNIIRDIAPLLKERGWGEVNEIKRGWGEVNEIKRGWGEVNEKERCSCNITGISIIYSPPYTPQSELHW